MQNATSLLADSYTNWVPFYRQRHSIYYQAIQTPTLLSWAVWALRLSLNPSKYVKAHSAKLYVKLHSQFL